MRLEYAKPASPENLINEFQHPVQVQEKADLLYTTVTNGMTLIEKRALAKSFPNNKRDRSNRRSSPQGGGKKKAKQQQRQQNEEGPCYDNVMCWWCLVRCCPCPQDVKKCRQGDEIWVGSSVPSPHPPPEGVSASTRSRMTLKHAKTTRECENTIL